MKEPTGGPTGFTIIEDDGVNITIEVSEEHHQADLAGGLNEDETMKPGRYHYVRGGFFARHPELKYQMRKETALSESVAHNP